MSSRGVAATARVTAKGQITIPVEVRRRLLLREGDNILFKISDGEPGVATVRRVPGWRELGGSVEVPDEWKDATWDEIREYAHSSVAARYLVETSSSTPTSSSDT